MPAPRVTARRLIGGAVRHDDVVVISDPFVAVVAEAVRERGALVVWQLELCPRRAAVAREWSFIARSSPPIDAYMTSWSTPLPGGRVQSGVAAFIAGADAVAAKEQKTAAGRPVVGRGARLEQGARRHRAGRTRGAPWAASCTRDRRSRCAERRVADRRAAGSPTVGLDACALCPTCHLCGRVDHES
jgi:hypothetical protein